MAIILFSFMHDWQTTFDDSPCSSTTEQGSTSCQNVAHVEHLVEASYSSSQHVLWIITSISESPMSCNKFLSYSVPCSSRFSSSIPSPASRSSWCDPTPFEASDNCSSVSNWGQTWFGSRRPRSSLYLYVNDCFLILNEAQSIGPFTNVIFAHPTWEYIFHVLICSFSTDPCDWGVSRFSVH